MSYASALIQSKNAARVSYDGGTAQEVLDEAKPMQSYAALRAYTGRATGVRITAQGISGFFYRDGADVTTADDGGVTIIDASGRRWKRTIFDNKVTTEMFGLDTAASGAVNSAAIKAALTYASANGCTVITSKPGTYVVAPQTSTYCIDLPSYTTWDIAKGVILQAESGIAATVRFMQSIGNSFITIYGEGATAKGIKSEYTTGEDRHGLRLNHTTNIRIHRMAFKDWGGDGIYVGSVCEDVILDMVECDNNRRNNLTIIGGKRIKVLYPKLTNANGTSPEAGLDIEPNSNDDFMEDIQVIGAYSSGNNGAGYVVSPNMLPGAVAKYVNVSLVDCQDNGSTAGFTVQKTTVGANTVTGKISFVRPVASNNAQSAFSVRNYDALSVPIYFIDPLAIDCSPVITAARYNAPFSVWNEATDTAPATIGNIHIIRPRIKYSGAAPNVVDFHLRALAAGCNVENCSIIEPQQIGHPGTAGKLYHANLTGARNIRITDPLGLMTHEGNETLQNYYFGTTYKNFTGAPATFTLQAFEVGYPDLTFVCADSGGLTITPDAGSKIQPLATVSGKYITTTQVGASVVLRRNSATTWQIVSIVGTWTVQP